MEPQTNMIPDLNTIPDPNQMPRSRPFLLMEGGPLYRIETRVGLVRANAPLTIRRAFVAICLTWLPLLIFTLLRGTAFSGVRIPFLQDFSAYGRFLLSIPLLLIVELILAPRIAEAAEQFLLSGIVTPKDYKRFDTAVEDGLRLRDSVLAEIVIAILAYGFTFTTYRTLAVHTSTWYSTAKPDGSYGLTGAGWWELIVCVPLLQFLLLRWLWRIFLWFRFLGHVSKFDLQLFGPHPDAAGGLGFVGEAQRFFGLLFFTYSCAVTGVVANEILYGGIKLQHYGPAIAAYAIFCLLFAALPLIVFTPKLLVTKRQSLHQYGALATLYTGSFHRRWIQGINPGKEVLLGSSDIQSLADLGNSFNFIENMKPLPIAPKDLIKLILMALLPMASLLLSIMSPKEIIQLLMKVMV
ncbi:hypothetical protein [Terriglobus sp. RCC_193]|uniref:hypothetical protein n=1 Tax=Terriglobus sp. RCC_193 TaxID=3239218 RepID=UPI0035239E8A